MVEDLTDNHSARGVAGVALAKQISLEQSSSQSAPATRLIQGLAEMAIAGEATSLPEDGAVLGATATEDDGIRTSEYLASRRVWVSWWHPRVCPR